MTVPSPRLTVISEVSRGPLLLTPADVEHLRRNISEPPLASAATPYSRRQMVWERLQDHAGGAAVPVSLRGCQLVVLQMAANTPARVCCSQNTRVSV